MRLVKYSVILLMISVPAYTQSWKQMFETQSTTNLLIDPGDSTKLIVGSINDINDYNILEISGDSVVSSKTLSFRPDWLTINPLNSNQWLVASGSTIYRSQDRGTSWAIIENSILYEAEWEMIWMPPADTSIYYAASGGPYPGSLYKSVDLGQSWTNLAGIQPTHFLQRTGSTDEIIYSSIYWTDSQLYRLHTTSNARNKLLTGDGYSEFFEFCDEFHIYRFWAMPNETVESYLVYARMERYETAPHSIISFSTFTMNGLDSALWSTPTVTDFLPLSYSNPLLYDGELYLPIKPASSSGSTVGIARSSDFGETWDLLDTKGMNSTAKGSNYKTAIVKSGDQETIFLSTDDGLYYAPLPLQVLKTYVGIDEPALLPISSSLGLPFPNPFNAQITIPIQISTLSGKYSVEVMDIMGKVIRRIKTNELNGGNTELYWNGNDQFNRPVSSGLYFILFRSSGLQETRKILLLK